MLTVRLGKTGLIVNKNGFGALPVQRVVKKDAVYLLRKAFDNGINYFDTARMYSDSEEKLGAALSDVRDKIVISTKTTAKTAAEFWPDLEESLRTLKTDFIDIYQFHNPEFCPKPNDGTGLYEAMLEARAQGKLRFIGITNHRLAIADEAVSSELYDTLQFPFSYLSTEADLKIVNACGRATSALSP
jgi:aryl-alcohol dehydrogenase-like predicted oxidoreductase